MSGRESLILSIDTTAEFGSIALLGAGLSFELPIHAPDGFGHVLFDQIGTLLKRSGADLRDVTRFAAASGPGSFTGVRVGLAAAKGLADATGEPLVAISNLKALASFGSRALRASLLNARRGEVYGAVYNADRDIVSGEVVAPLARWLEAIGSWKDGDIEFLAQDFTAFSGALPAGIPQTVVPRALALAIARLAMDAAPEDPAAIDANYVRRSDAELFWKD